MFRDHVELLRRACRAARRAVRLAVALAPPAAAALLCASPSRAASSAHLNINIDIRGIAPVFDLTAAPGASSGTIALSWTEPTRTAGAAPYVYDVRISSLAQIADNAAFLAAAPLADLSPSLPPAPGAGGGAAGFVVTDLIPNVTYYFAVREKDSATVSGVWARSPTQGWNVNNFAVATAPPPSAAPFTPSGLSAAAGLRGVVLTWNALPPSEQGAGLLHYFLQRSTNAGFGYVTVATTTAVSLSDKPLSAGTTYFYRIGARDVLSLESLPSASVFAAPFTLRPMEPMGVTVAATGATVALAWSPTARFDDGTSFTSTAAPDGDELLGYAVQRSSDICSPAFVTIASVPFSSTALVDASGGLNYYYRIFSYNSLGVSSNALTVSSLGERSFLAGDCAGALTLDGAGAAALNGATNGRGADIRIESRRRPEDVSGPVFQSFEWRAFLDGATELSGFALPKPARVVLRFDVQGGVVIPSPAAVAAKDLGMYWHNGAEFKKLYGKVDAAARTVTVESPNLGIYQIRSLFREDGAVFDLSNASNRVITPNGDGKNDLLIFTYDPGPRDAAVSGRIYDMTGAFVADMTPGLVPNTLAWDGKMNGRAASGGVYVYKIEGDGKTYAGTVVVAH